MSGFDLGSVFVTIKAVTTDFTKGLQDAKADLGGFSSKIGGVATAVGKTLTLAAAAGAGALGALGYAGLRSAADLQTASTSFQVLIGDVDTANRLLGQLSQYANNTPFEFPDVAQAAKTLSGFGLATEKILPTIKNLGNIAAVTGAPLKNLSVVFGQVYGAGRLQAENFLQLVDMGVPIGRMLQDVGINLKDLDKIWQAGGISIDKFNEAFAKADQQGQFAFQGTDKLAQTFNGRMSTLKDTVLEFGRNLLGVRVDPQLGLVVQEGGLFDLMSKGIVGIIDALNTLKPTVLAVSEGIAGFTNMVLHPSKQMVDAFKMAWDFLKPSIDLFWANIKGNLIPALSNLWHNFLEPLMPLIGALLVGAIWLLINALTFAVGTIAYVANKLGNFGKFVQDTAYNVTSFFLDMPGNISRAVAGVYNAIITPFKKAFDWLMSKAESTMKTIKSWLDPFQRHSPSLVDRVTKGVTEIRDQYQSMFDSLEDMARNGAVRALAPAISPASLLGGDYAINAALAAPGATSAGVSVNVDLRNTNIVGTVPRDVAEQIGDATVKRLKQSVRF